MSSEIFRRDQAQRYAPKTPSEVLRAARDLAASGYSARTISVVLNIDIVVVHELIGEPKE